jgi:hypothetical protein
VKPFHEKINQFVYIFANILYWKTSVFNITPELFHIIARGRRGRDRM